MSTGGVGGFARRVLAAAIGVALTAPAAAQNSNGASTEWRTKKVDSRNLARKDAEREMIEFGRCIANNRYERAKAIVLLQFGSKEQAAAAPKALPWTEDNCLRNGPEKLEIQFRYDVLAGAIAQGLVLRDYPDLGALIAAHPLDPKLEAAALPLLTPGEMFGRCVVQRDPASAAALIAAMLATDEEGAAIAGLRDDLGPCLAAGDKLELTPLSLRNMVGVGAYRYAQQLDPRGRTASLAAH